MFRPSSTSITRPSSFVVFFLRSVRNINTATAKSKSTKDLSLRETRKLDKIAQTGNQQVDQRLRLRTPQISRESKNFYDAFTSCMSLVLPRAGNSRIDFSITRTNGEMTEKVKAVIKPDTVGFFGRNSTAPKSNSPSHSSLSPPLEKETELELFNNPNVNLHIAYHGYCGSMKEPVTEEVKRQFGDYTVPK